MKNLLALFLLAPLLGCDPEKEDVDLLLVNARVYTVDNAFTTASSFAVKDGKFVAVGEGADLEERYEARNKLDARGRAVVPGFIDAHCHFYDLGLKQQQLNLTGTKSFKEVLDTIASFMTVRGSTFIFGKGWDQNDWERKEFPDNSELNRLYPDIPVVLERIDGHAYLVNEAAMKLAGIGPGTEATGGTIVKKDGKPTGLLIDGPMNYVNAVIPRPSRAMQIAALENAEKICTGYGLTTIDDAGLSRAVITLIDSLQKAGRLNIRVYAMVSANVHDLDYYLERGPYKTDRLNVRSVKVYSDGALGSRGAALKAPYSDEPGHYGALVTPGDQIERLASRIARSEFQMNTHAIGDSANALVLRTYKRALEGMSDRRWRVEHAQVVAAEDAVLFGGNIIPSVQPTHATSDMYWAKERLGEARINRAYAYKTLLGHAGRLALGTDFPVEEVNPFLTFYAAVTRQDVSGFPEGGYHYNEALSREQALRGMTIWAAFSNFEEAEKGSIEPGKWADFLILSDDIMEVDAAAIPHLTAESVFIGGEEVN